MEQPHTVSRPADVGTESAPRSIEESLDPDAAPLVYTVEEAARILRISRSLAYALARRYLATDGREGLPVLRVGSCLRVPAWALLEFIHTGRTVALVAPSAPAAERTNLPIDSRSDGADKGWSSRGSRGPTRKPAMRTHAAEQPVLLQID